MGKKLNDGAYSAMLQRLRAANNPNLLFLSYDKPSFTINNFFAIPKDFFIRQPKG
jgi:hypothetical protein